MAKAIRRSTAKRRKFAEEKPVLRRENFFIIGGGLIVIVAGYLALMEDSVEGFLPLVVAPILLVIGYCVVIPFGIMYRKKAEKAAKTADR